MSIQGVQPKLSAFLVPRQDVFRIVDIHGRYIIKPPHPYYPNLPENESLTMTLAQVADIEVPVFGLLWNADNTLSYVVRRFDRAGKKKRFMEDTAQLAGRSRDTKYDFTMERIVPLIERYCTFPKIDLLRLFRLVIFCFLTGNEDLHLKNIAVIRTDGIVRLSPAYDLVNTTLVLGANAEESALPVQKKRKNLSYKTLVTYMGQERFGLPPAQTDAVLHRYATAMLQWHKIIESSFLPEESQFRYLTLIEKRAQRLNLG